MLSSAAKEELRMAAHFDFHIVEPDNIPGFSRTKTSKPNVFTIGAAFYYGLQIAQSEYVLFLENDFKIDTSLSRTDIMLELFAAAALLRGGAEVVRLLSRKSMGCGTFHNCDHKSIHLNATDPTKRLRNWFSFYCRNQNQLGTSNQLVHDCFEKPNFRCFTSWDSNWSLNAVMIKKSSMLTKRYPTAHGMKTIAEIGLSHYRVQDGFEMDMY